METDVWFQLVLPVPASHWTTNYRNSWWKKWSIYFEKTLSYVRMSKWFLDATGHTYDDACRTICQERLAFSTNFDAFYANDVHEAWGQFDKGTKERQPFVSAAFFLLLDSVCCILSCICVCTLSHLCTVKIINVCGAQIFLYFWSDPKFCNPSKRLTRILSQCVMIKMEEFEVFWPSHIFDSLKSYSSVLCAVGQKSG